MYVLSVYWISALARYHYLFRVVSFSLLLKYWMVCPLFPCALYLKLLWNFYLIFHFFFQNFYVRKSNENNEFIFFLYCVHYENSSPYQIPKHFDLFLLRLLFWREKIAKTDIVRMGDSNLLKWGNIFSYCSWKYNTLDEWMEQIPEANIVNNKILHQ